jgi:hypothetical protein
MRNSEHQAARDAQRSSTFFSKRKTTMTAVKQFHALAQAAANGIKQRTAVSAPKGARAWSRALPSLEVSHSISDIFLVGIDRACFGPVDGKRNKYKGTVSHTRRAARDYH